VTDTPTSVRDILDELTGGLRPGDNVVLQSDDETDTDPVLAAALQPKPDEAPLVYVSFQLSPGEVSRRFRLGRTPDSFLIVDCSTRGQDAEPAAPDVQVQRLADATAETVRSTLQTITHELGPGTTYVFDGLTGMQERWNADEALSLFLWACPKLYEERTIAYWTLRRTVHTPAFLSRLSQATQVVVDLGRAGDRCWMELRKAAGRPDDLLDARIEFVTDDGGARLVERSPAARQGVGKLIKQQRTAAGLSQAELARRVGVSASALSQTERGRHGISGDVLIRVWEALGVTLSEVHAGRLTHRVFPRSGRVLEDAQPGLQVETILEDADMEAYILQCSPGASGNRPFFATKRREFGVVLDGVLQVSIGQSDETLQQGDAIVVNEPLRAWRNPADVPARALWMLLS